MKTWFPIALLVFLIENAHAGKKIISNKNAEDFLTFMNKIDSGQDISQHDFTYLARFFKENVFDETNYLELTDPVINQFLIEIPKKLLSSIFIHNENKLKSMNEYIVFFEKVFRAMPTSDQEKFFPFIVDLFKDEDGNKRSNATLLALDYLNFIKKLASYLRRLANQGKNNQNAVAKSPLVPLASLKSGLNGQTFMKFFINELRQHFSREIQLRKEPALGDYQAELKRMELNHLEEDQRLFERLLINNSPNKNSPNKDSPKKAKALPENMNPAHNLAPLAQNLEVHNLSGQEPLKPLIQNPTRNIGTLDRFAKLAYDIIFAVQAMPQGQDQADVHAIDGPVNEFYGYISALSQNDGVEPITSLDKEKLDNVFNEIKNKFNLRNHKNIDFLLENIERNGRFDGLKKDRFPYKPSVRGQGYYIVPSEPAIDQFREDLLHDSIQRPREMLAYVRAVDSLNIAMKAINSLPGYFQQVLTKDFVDAFSPVVSDVHGEHLIGIMDARKGLCGPGYLDRIIRALATLFIKIRIIRDPLIKENSIDENMSLQILEGNGGSGWKELIKKRDSIWGK